MRLITTAASWARLQPRRHLIRHLGERCELGDPAPCDSAGGPWTGAVDAHTHVCWDDTRVHPVSDQAILNVLAALTGPQLAALRTALLDDDPEGTTGEQARTRREKLRELVLDHPQVKARYAAEVTRLTQAQVVTP